MLGKSRPVEQNAALNNRLRCFPDRSQLPIASARADVDDNWNIDRTRAIKLPYLDGEACFVGSLRTLVAAIPDLMDALVD